MPTLHDLLSPIDIDLDQLLLDPNNPRFAELGDNDEPVPELRIAEERVQRDTFDRMKSKRFDVTELRDTIKAVGYLPMDRIVVKSWAGNREGARPKYVVVEGNRRVAALRWLKELHDTGRETLTEEQLRNFTHLPALLLDHERAPETIGWILPGLRHVSGVKEWGPYQRARAVHILREAGNSPQEVAQSLGLPTRAANQLWRSYLALEQMRSDEEFGEEADPRMYSYFEEIMRRPNVRDWFAWSDAERGFTNHSRTRELYAWMVGEPREGEGEEGRSDPKLPEAKSIRELSRFIEDEGAMAIFRSPDGSLTRAVGRFEAEHQPAWQGAVASAQTTLAAVPPDALRSMSELDISLLSDLRARIDQVLNDRARLLLR
ncbi:MAG: hypothetical protein QME77_03490 [bacterium]|nr:hypothetical protein [bacterium]